jgi:hypothetical protein
MRIRQSWAKWSGRRKMLPFGIAGILVICLACSLVVMIMPKSDLTPTPQPVAAVEDTSHLSTPVPTSQPQIQPTYTLIPADKQESATMPPLSRTPSPTATLEVMKTPRVVATLETSPTRLEFDVNVHVEDGKPSFEIETNLPDGMEIMFTVLANQDIWGQAKERVVSGAINIGPFSRKGEPYPPGTYRLEITSPLLSLQPPEVQAIMGEDGENFHDDHIAEGRVDFQIVFTVSGDQEETKRLKEEELLSFEEHIIYLREKMDLLDQNKQLGELEWSISSREWSIDLRTRKEAFQDEFGEHLGQYVGFCQDAFMYIGITYNEIPILRQNYDSFYFQDKKDSKEELETRKSELDNLLDDATMAMLVCQGN